MRRISLLIALAAGAGLVSGCVVIPVPSPIKVVLVNETALDVTPKLFVSGSASNEDELFTGENAVTDFTDRAIPELRGGETREISRECEELRAIGVRGALRFDGAMLTLTTAPDEIFLLFDRDFGCGATVRLIYYNDGADFRVRFEVQ